MSVGDVGIKSKVAALHVWNRQMYADSQRFLRGKKNHWRGNG